MIAVTGGTGTLGRFLVARLSEGPRPFRLLVRDGSRPPAGVETVTVDLADRASLASALAGADAIVSAMTAFGGARGTTPRAVDGDGNRNLIRAAADAGVRRFFLVSIRGASADHPIDVYREKARAEQELADSALDWTIVRPTVYMETWGEVIGRPVLEGKGTRVFGAGDNPINFISADDVARMIVGLIDDPAATEEAIDLAGPENLTLGQVVATFERLAGRPARVQHVPVALMRAASVLLRPVSSTGARFASAGLSMATAPMAADAAATRRRFPDIELTTFDEFATRRAQAPATRTAA